jgi:hypothetical protein
VAVSEGVVASMEAALEAASTAEVLEEGSTEVGHSTAAALPIMATVGITTDTVIVVTGTAIEAMAMVTAAATMAGVAAGVIQATAMAGDLGLAGRMVGDTPTALGGILSILIIIPILIPIPTLTHALLAILVRTATIILRRPTPTQIQTAILHRRIRTRILTTKATLRRRSPGPLRTITVLGLRLLSLTPTIRLRVRRITIPAQLSRLTA